MEHRVYLVGAMEDSKRPMATQGHTMHTKAYGTWSAEGPMEAMPIQRRQAGPREVAIKIDYCGICHSDLHTAHNQWPGTLYPCVPGHEIVGRVTAVGESVSRFKPGDLVAVGCMVDSCQSCGPCREGLEQFCGDLPMYTYNSRDKHLEGHTLGGYSQRIVVDGRFVLSVPKNLDPASTALGATVTVLTTSPSKVVDAHRLGADHVVLSTDRGALKELRGSLDLILDCVSAQDDINALLRLLGRDATLVLVGLPEKPLCLAPPALVAGRKSLSGSSIGGIAETQEMLDFCGRHHIGSDIELIPIQGLDRA